MLKGDVCVLSGGTGTPKLLQGLVRLVSPDKLKIIVNTADDVTVAGLYVCPDVDAVLYTLAGIIDDEKWYGIRGDTYRVYEERRTRGFDDILRLGDRDRQNSAYRTALLEAGKTLSFAVDQQRKRMGILQEVFPMCDSKVTTNIVTPRGIKEFQEYWVRDGGKDEVIGVTFEGLDDATISEGAKRALREASLIIIGPSNPITSIGPILGVKGVLPLLKSGHVTAVSPLRAGSPFSGPAGRMLLGLGYEVSPISIAALYREFLDELIIDPVDASLRSKISRTFGIKVYMSNLTMRTPADKFKLAQAALRAISQGDAHGR